MLKKEIPKFIFFVFKKCFGGFAIFSMKPSSLQSILVLWTDTPISAAELHRAYLFPPEHSLISVLPVKASLGRFALVAACSYFLIMNVLKLGDVQRLGFFYFF